MKNRFKILWLILMVCYLYANESFAQRPAKVVSIVKEDNDFNYYKTLAQQWKAVVDKSPSDADAWFNYYYANRYARMFRKEYKSTHESYIQDPKEIVKNALNAIPGTYEYYFLMA